MQVGGFGNYPGERRFARAGRSPQDEGFKCLVFCEFPQRPFDAYEMILADDIIQRARTERLG